MQNKKIVLITEQEKIIARLNRSYTERFRLLMRLIKLTSRLKEATLVHSEV